MIKNKSIRYVYKRYFPNFTNDRFGGSSVKDYCELVKCLRYFKNGNNEIESVLYWCDDEVISKNVYNFIDLVYWLETICDRK
jgi:hypothetical protein